MKILKIFIILSIIFLPLENSFAQKFGTGLLLSDSLYKNRPLAAPLMRGDYSNLPTFYSLKEFAPTPGNQSIYSTCAGWAVAYEAKTILIASKHQWDQAEIDSNAFSPSFIYNQLTKSNDCMGGTSLIDALQVLKNQGDLKLDEFAYDCDRKVTTSDKKIASKYKILEYRDVCPAGVKDKTRFVKKCIAEQHPVVIAIDCPYSFGFAKDVWLPDSSDYKLWNRGHAITVIAYDDSKYGGAFQVMNSWGINWGNGGFTWIRYKDFNYFCKYAFEVIDPSPIEPNTADLSGSLLFRESNGDEMNSKFDGKIFVTTSTYPSGTLFDLRISNNEPAYVYAFGTDTTFKATEIFPFKKNMLAYLPYKQNNIAIPDEESYNMLDNVKGPAYYCFLYSKKSLDFSQILKNFEQTNGTVWQRITHILGDDIVKENNIKFNYEGKINFQAKSEGKDVVPVILEIKHQ